MAGIFISYRRSDSAGYAGRLADDLAEHLDGQAIFRDIDAIEPGVDFVHALEKAVASCSVMLVLIGPTWACASNADGQRRLHRPGDIVRLEIEAALARDIRVIPVLVGNAQLPDAAELPDSMAGLLRRHAYSISDQRWQYDIEQLLAILVKIPGVAALRAHPPMPPPPLVVGAAPAPRPQTMATTTPPQRGGAAWVIGAVATVVVLGIGIGMGIGLTRMPRDSSTDADAAMTEPAQADVTGTTSAIAADEQPFLGRWIAADGSHWLIDTSEEGLYVATGTSLAAGTGFSDDAPAPDRPGMELFGDAGIAGNRLSANLVDAYDGAVTVMELTISDDGSVLEGHARQGDEPETYLELTRR
jgi:hypothetical protein